MRPRPLASAGAPTLDRIGALLQYLGSPQLEYPAVHITGTNGKTSATRMVTELFSTVGLLVGATTSPHLERVNERMTVNGEPISDADLDEQLRVVALVEREIGLDPSYFEVVIAAALRWFADVAIDVAVVEVGMGGTWDATNVIDGQVAVVTNVSIDHVAYLGSTPEEIAAEKAGIVKEGSTLVLGETDPDLVPIFTGRGAARVLQRDIDFGVRSNVPAFGGRMLELFTPDARYPDVFVPLHGAHQGDNAAVALAAAEAFVGAPLDPDAVRGAFARVRSPGRLELVGRHPLVLLDGAHNVAGAEALRRALAEEFAPASRTLVVGLLREKDPRDMLPRPRPRRRRATRLRAAAESAGARSAADRGRRHRARISGRPHRRGRHRRPGDLERTADDRRGRRDHRHRIALLRGRGPQHPRRSRIGFGVTALRKFRPLR